MQHYHILCGTLFTVLLMVMRPTLRLPTFLTSSFLTFLAGYVDYDIAQLSSISLVKGLEANFGS